MNSDSPAQSPFFEGENSEVLHMPVCNGLNLLPWQNGDVEATPPNFTTARQAKYPLGTRCRCVPTPQTDWGTVIGQIYAPDQKNSHQWSWLYLLLLDSDSPSRGWIVADWVDEEDLELLPAKHSQSISRTDREAL